MSDRRDVARVLRRVLDASEARRVELGATCHDDIYCEVETLCGQLEAGLPLSAACDHADVERLLRLEGVTAPAYVVRVLAKHGLV
jgi:hypothetical protein